MQRSTKQSILIRPPYVYSPVHADPLLTDIIRYSSDPRHHLVRGRNVAAGPHFSTDFSPFKCRRA